ncbi:MAG: ATP-binding cassette domain-containing protein [Candidatus Campbellbacteria bacterium]|nr:ATP-binding cassette domain-containing protein [Candidatus Campbellbacteria bacterium]
MNRNPLILIQDASYSIRDQLLWHISHLTLFSGDCVGLIGDNGTGKTTLLKMIHGDIAPDTGSCTVNGKVFIVPQKRDADKEATLATLLSKHSVSKHLFEKEFLTLSKKQYPSTQK